MNFLLTYFPALKHNYFRLYLLGQLISFSGNWVQVVTQGWYVYTLSNSAFLVGLITTFNALPTLLFGLFVGLIVDRYPKKQLILVTQSLSFLCALSLAIAVFLNILTIPLLFMLAFLLGVINAIDNPARQSFIIEMVGKENLTSAIALNGSVFQIARAFGPAAAGILIYTIGSGGAFLLNALSYLPIILTLLLMHLKTHFEKYTFKPPFTEIKEEISYCFTHPITKLLLPLIAVTSIFGWSYLSIMPVIAAELLNQNAVGLGYMFTAIGTGAFLATIFISIFAKKIHYFSTIGWGTIVFSIALIALSLTTHLWVGYIALFFAGFGLTTQLALVNATIQLHLDNKIRGRIMSIYTLVLLGFSPVGSLLMGYLAEEFRVANALLFGGIVVFLFALYYMASFKKEFKRLHQSVI